MTRDEYSEQIAQMSKSMFRYCLSRTNSYHDAEDLAQEILLISCKGENSFPNEKAFYAFVWRTADNILRGWYRDRNKRDTAELDETISDGSWEALEEQAAENEQLRLITRELSHLNSNYRHAMVAHYVDGMSVKDISEGFGISQSMVKYLLFQSRKRIREGIDMERNYGKLSYDPIELNALYWGKSNNYYGKFDDKITQNILMCCYYDKQSEEQLSLQLGVPTAYLEDDIKKLVKYGLLTEKNGFYQTGVPIITKEVYGEIGRANKDSVSRIADLIKAEIEGMADEVRALGFYGSDMPQNTLKWLLLSLILRLAYCDMVPDESRLELQTDIFGDKCFRWFSEKENGDPYLFGTYSEWCGGGMIIFWDVVINGDMLHPHMTVTRADMLCSLLSRQPQTDNEKLVCSELVELGLAVRTDKGVMPNFPCLTKAQGDELNSAILGIAEEITQDILSRTDTVKSILIDRTPANLADYVSKMALLLHFREAELVTQHLCESGWLLPMKCGMSGTTVMYLNK